MTASDTSVLVVTYNSAGLVDACLDDAVRLGAREILVWDNASTDETRERLLRWAERPDIEVVIAPTNSGFGAAVNQLARRATGSTLLLLNPDCRVDPEAIEAMHAELGAATRVAACAPMMRYPDGTYGINGGGEPTLLKEVISELGLFKRLGAPVRRSLARLSGLWPGSSSAQMLSTTQPGAPLDVQWLSGFCLLVRTEAWREVGGFDEKYFMYYEDVDLARRLRAAGYRLRSVRSVSALHHESQSSTRQGKSRAYRESRRVFFNDRTDRGAMVLTRLMESMGRW